MIRDVHPKKLAVHDDDRGTLMGALRADAPFVEAIARTTFTRLHERDQGVSLAQTAKRHRFRGTDPLRLSRDRLRLEDPVPMIEA
jgi:hypothetical protein